LIGLLELKFTKTSIQQSTQHNRRRSHGVHASDGLFLIFYANHPHSRSIDSIQLHLIIYRWVAHDFLEHHLITLAYFCITLRKSWRIKLWTWFCWI
jgi:hypothetical protein